MHKPSYWASRMVELVMVMAAVMGMGTRNPTGLAAG